MKQCFTPRSLGMVELYDEVTDDVGDPVILVRMAMDRQTAEDLYAAANSECAEAHRELASIMGDLALGALQLHMDHEISTLTS